MQVQEDHTFSYKHNEEKAIIPIVYIDDTILAGDDVEEMTRVKEGLASSLDIVYS